MATSIPNLAKITQIAAEFMAIFRFFSKWGPAVILDFVKVKNGITERCGLSMSSVVPNLVTISQMAAELLRFSVFQNGGQPPSWILLDFIF